jgi:hypothetical protein
LLRKKLKFLKLKILVLEAKKISTNPTNDKDEIKEEKSDHEFAKAFIYDATSKDQNSFAHIKELFEQNKFYGDIILPKISAQNNVIVRSIEEQLGQ